jgi:hypothetical protein
MRKWLLFLSSVFIVSCSSVDCPVKNVVATYYNIYDSDGNLLVLLDTLTIISKTKEGKDTILLNRGVEISAFSLQISKSHPEDELYFHFYNENGYDKMDTVWIQKEDYPHFESLECKAEFFHKLTGVCYTKHAIDSLVIKNSNVDYDDTKIHFYLYPDCDH